MAGVSGAILRRQSVGVRVGPVLVGGGAPIVVQSMTNTDTADPASTVEQVRQLWEAGSEIVRITVNDRRAARAVPEIREKLDALHVPVPLVGDFHFNGHQLLHEFPDAARALHKYRINPGNVGRGEKRDKQFAMIVEKAIEHDKPVRIGVNWGSLDPELVTQLMDENAAAATPREADAVMREAMVVSALSSAARAEDLGLARDHVILSVKMSRVQDLIAVYRDLAAKTDHALHLGLTEAGLGSKGIVSSAAALGILLQEGIGDTIRISLTPDPGAPRTKEVEVAQELLQSMGFRSFIPLVTACPGCGRTTSTLFQELALDIQSYIRERMPLWREEYPGSEGLKVAVMGCIVNGPGESKHADIGISLPGNGEDPAAPVFIDGSKVGILRGDKIAQEFQAIVEDYVERRYGDGGAAAAE